MIGGRENRDIRRPLTAPHAAPTPSDATMAAPSPQPILTDRTPMTTPHNPTIEPTEISIPPVAITSVIPAATIAISAPLLRMTDTLSPVRNPGNVFSSQATATTST